MNRELTVKTWFNSCGVGSEISSEAMEHLHEDEDGGEIDMHQLASTRALAWKYIEQYVLASNSGPESDSQSEGNSESASWYAMPEIPSEEEAGWIENGELKYPDGHDLPLNRLDGPFSDRDQYLKIWHTLMRNDAVIPLSECINEIRLAPGLPEHESKFNRRVYESVSVSTTP